MIYVACFILGAIVGMGIMACCIVAGEDDWRWRR